MSIGMYHGSAHSNSEPFNVDLGFGAYRMMGGERKGEGDQAAEIENNSAGDGFKLVPMFSQ